MVSQGHTDFGPARMTLAIEEAARERGYATALSVVRDAGMPTVEATVDLFLSHGIDGIDGIVVITPVPTLADAAKQLAARTPVVIVTSGLWPADNMNVAGIDQELGARRATEHLIELGHRSIVHIAGPMDWFDAKGRVVGWRQALAVADLKAPPMLHATDWTAESAYQAAQQLLAWDTLPEAIFAANDFIALGLIRALEENGLAVPRDISVVGYDDVDAAGYFSPPLTTIRQSFELAGQAALELLLDQSDGMTQVPNFIAPELILRGSTRPQSRRWSTGSISWSPRRLMVGPPMSPEFSGRCSRLTTPPLGSMCWWPPRCPKAPGSPHLQRWNARWALPPSSFPATRLNP